MQVVFSAVAMRYCLEPSILKCCGSSRSMILFREIKLLIVFSPSFLVRIWILMSLYSLDTIYFDDVFVVSGYYFCFFCEIFNKLKLSLNLIWQFIKGEGISICKQNSCEEGIPLKFLLLILSLVHELEIMQRRTDGAIKLDLPTNSKMQEILDGTSLILEKFSDVLVDILVISIQHLTKSMFFLGHGVSFRDSSPNCWKLGSLCGMQGDLISFAESSCSIFWSNVAVDASLPGSVTGKLGGPSQRRLSSSTTTAVLQAVSFIAYIFCRWKCFIRDLHRFIIVMMLGIAFQ